MDQTSSGSIYSQKDDLAISDDRKIKEDEASVSSIDEVLLNRSLKVTYFSFENIRFTPRIIEFVDAYEGKQFSEKLTIQNIGRNPVLVKIGEPNSFIFQMKKPNQRLKFLPAGASLSKTITYTYHNTDLVSKSQLPVQINNCVIDFPIVVKKAQPEIEVTPQKLHFQIINLGASAKAMTLTIYNSGGKRTKFEIDCGKNFNLVVTPVRGTIKPKQSVDVCVEIMGFSEGEYYQELWIKTAEAPIRVPVFVEVVRPRLEIIYPIGTENFTLLNFPPTFKGAQRALSFIIKNVSVETTLFVTLAEVNGELQVLKNAKTTSDSFNMFVMPAEEGRLEPFENRVFNVLFRPRTKIPRKGWYHREHEKKSPKCDHVIFLRIKTVHCIELKELVKIGMKYNNNPTKEKVDDDQKSLLDLKDIENISTFERSPSETDLSGVMDNFMNGSPLPEDKALRLCIHGQGIDPDVLIQPTSLEFGDLVLGQTENKVLRLTNNSLIPIRCRFCKKLNVKTTPEEVWLRSEKSREILVSLSPTCAGVFKTKLKVQVLAESDVFYSSDESEVTIAECAVLLTYNARDARTVPKPKVGLGITPLIKDEVGCQKELILYKDAAKYPYAAMLGLKHGFRPAWMRKEEDRVNNVDNAIIALPNDRPRLFYSWPKEKICRSIFKGFYRYSPPEDLTYTLSPEGRIEKKERFTVWAEYISSALTKENHRDSNQLEYLKDFFIRKLEKLGPKLDLEANTGAEISKKNEKFPKVALVPLSPKFLYQIQVEPKLIDFSQVAIASKVQGSITITNLNPFPISVRFIPGISSSLWVMENGTITVLPWESMRITVFFRPKEFGRFFGFLNYVINDSHEFKIPISAVVQSRTLFLTEKFLEFGIYGPKEAFQPRSLFLFLENSLLSPTKYRMNLSDDSAFVTDIKEGEIPPRSKLLVEIFFDLSPKKSFYSDITFISESGNSESIKLSHPCKKVAVDFLTNEVDMRDIPLNLPTKVKPVIMNACYHDVSFEVLTLNPMPGVTVEPKEGVIKPRSFLPLHIIVQIPVIMKFSFEVLLNVHFASRISVKVTGNVVFPAVRIRPTEVTMRKICEQSFDTVAICVVNEGTTRAEMEVDFRTCPEFTVEGPPLISLPPNKAEKIVVRFEPKNVARYIFYLPAIINGILGPPMIQERETESASFYISTFESTFEEYGEVFISLGSKLKIPCVIINSTVLPALLQISPMNVTFQEENNSKSQNVEIVNVSNEKVTFCVRNDDLGESNESPFDLSPVPSDSVEYRLKSMKAQLSPGEKLLLRATFEPKKHGVFNADVPVFVRGYNNGLVYNYIRLSGKLRASLLHPMSSEIYFAPVPLGVACDVILTVCAENYSVPDTINCVICDLPNESNESNEQVQDKLTTKWLVEPKISGCSKAHVFRLQIIFQSFVPIALRKYILLLDSLGGYATILVTAVADNSAMTTHAFLATRSSQYKLVRDPEIPKEKLEIKEKEKVFENPVVKTGTKSDLKFHPSTEKTQDKQGSKSTVEFIEVVSSESAETPATEPTEKGPRLVIQITKSMSRTTQLGFAKIIKITKPCKTCFSSRDLGKSDVKFSFPNRSESTMVSKVTINTRSSKPKPSLDDVSYPNFPEEDHLHWNYFKRTITYIERWMFEVVMRCDQYFSIPESFQRPMQRKKNQPKGKAKSEKQIEKDFLSFLEEIVGNDGSLPKRPIFNRDVSETEKAKTLRLFFSKILQFLKDKGCLLPHIRPEYLLEYEDYDAYTKSTSNTEFFFWENFEIPKMNSLRMIDDTVTQAAKNKTEKEMDIKEVSSVLLPKDFWEKAFFESAQQLDMQSEKFEEGNSEPTPRDQMVDSVRNIGFCKQFDHSLEVLDKITFNFRSTQAWLDIIIQIFRVFVLSKIFKKNTIPVITSFEPSDKPILETPYLCSFGNYYKRSSEDKVICEKDSFSSNIYSIQERVLLGWLNHHFQMQKDILWAAKDKCWYKNKILNNFDKDLSDSVALIALTAAHCPYIVPDFFRDVFPKPDTPNKMQHNAGRLIQAWRTLQVGLTVETRDIITPNSVFMLMLLTHLYEVLPLLHPRSSISFLAPLNSETSRTIQLKNDSHQRVVYQAKFFGEHERFFRLHEVSLIEIKPLKTKTITVTFSSKEIRKKSATLFLCGCIESPDFGKHLAFNLEGEPSELTEYGKLSFSAPLFKMICTEIPVKSPYQEPTTYEVWYTTKKPQYAGQPESSFKPWSVIWKTKASRRLFLNKSEVRMEEAAATLSITVACLTHSKRLFWLLFRSEIGSFIFLIEINTKLPEPQTLSGLYPEAWSASSCTCVQKSSPKLTNCSCPCLTVLKIPIRNEPLWDALRTMFLKTLHQQEKSFWNEYFERNIGICLILWLLSPEEEEEVLDEFVGVLSTKVTYRLQMDPPNNHVVIPQTIEIPDVRERSEIAMPIHISKEAPSKLSFTLTMVSENEKETRSLKVQLRQPNHEKSKALFV